MKNKYLILSTLLLLWAHAVSLKAQVTIGSKDAPVLGALIQLKESGVFGNDANSNKGLGMPRVKLTDLHNLYPMFEPDGANYKIGATSYNKTTEDFKHIGLMVYHTDKCTMTGAGLYVWDKGGWIKVDGDQTPGGLTLSSATLDFASGQDLRSLVAKPFSVTWAPNGAGIIPPKWAYEAGSYPPLNFTTLTPASDLLTNSPQAMTILPVAMTSTEISTNPFLTKDRKVVFTFGECNNAIAAINISQTNKALRVNGSTATAFQVLHTADALNQALSVSSNAQWKMNMVPAPNANSAVVTSITPDSVNGSELNNSTGQILAHSYSIKVGAIKDRYTTLIFTDNQSTKRFNDVKVNIAQCAGTTDLTMQEWANRLGTAQDVISPNGVAWHKDQSDNIFLSMNYDATNPMGSNNRWMITNLAATIFAPNAGRTGSDKTVVQNFGTNPSAVNNFLTPQWVYPKANASVTIGEAASTEFKNRERLGRLYNWAAATNSLGGITNNGQDIPNDAEGNLPYPAHRKVQGICPNGWHLPSDYDWTDLENAIILKTSVYSATPDIVSPMIASSNNSGNRGTHGKAMLDTCEPTIGYGTSNSPLSGGFSTLLAGHANTGYTKLFGSYGFYWSASHNKNGSSAINRIVNNSIAVGANATTRDNNFSVRCKKDN